jgi:hypothetical protein
VRCLILRYSCVLALAALAPPGAGAEPLPRYPQLHTALAELREARTELASARYDFGGRRDAALQAIDEAVLSLKLILRLRGDNVRVADRGADFYSRYRNYPRLRQALSDLRDAREELRNSRVDFGDMRGRAEKSIEYAIDQIRELVRDEARDRERERDRDRLTPRPPTRLPAR